MIPSVRIACLAFALLGLGAWPQDPPARPAEAKKSAWLHEQYLNDAAEYDFALDEAGRQKLELRREPAMRWTSEGDYNGEVFVWTHQGQAAVVGCVFSGPLNDGQRRVMHEFHSLAPGPLHAGKKGGSGWLPGEAGIEPRPLPDEPEPANNRTRRLTQMRDIARHFTAKVERGGKPTEMRLLPQPIYRYEVADDAAPIVDGAVFTFVWDAGTDPEVLVVIEARRVDGGVRWSYAPARFTNREAWLKYRDKEVWRADPATVGIFDGVTSKPYGAYSLKTIANPVEGR